MSKTSSAIDGEILAINATGAARRLSISRGQFWKLHAAEKVPRPVYLGEKAPRWLVEELRDWLVAGAPDRTAWEAMKAVTSPRAADHPPAPNSSAT